MTAFGIFSDSGLPITFGRIITKRRLRALFMAAEHVCIVRSGVYAELEHCADVIEEVCRTSATPKRFCIVLPSILNPDLVTRATEAGRRPEDVLANLGAWHEVLARLAARLMPRHLIEVRTTMEPHRYHAIFSETQAVLGIPWHTEASITTSSFVIGPNASEVISKLHKDFEVFFERCTPYELGDDERLRKQKLARVIDDEILWRFSKKAAREVIEMLHYIAHSFPLVDGSGVTKAHLIEKKWYKDESSASHRLSEMEHAGLLYRVWDSETHSPSHGRLISDGGRILVRKYKDLPPES
jgi:hypothetical protein